MLQIPNFTLASKPIINPKGVSNITMTKSTDKVENNFQDNSKNLATQAKKPKKRIILKALLWLLGIGTVGLAGKFGLNLSNNIKTMQNEIKDIKGMLVDNQVKDFYSGIFGDRCPNGLFVSGENQNGERFTTVTCYSDQDLRSFIKSNETLRKKCIFNEKDPSGRIVRCGAIS